SGADMDGVFSVLPQSRTQVYDMRRIVRAVVDKDTLFELKPRFGKSALTGLARLGGKSVGIVANNPLHRGGALDADACRKITDFLVLCDSFNVPVVLLVDTPGFQIGTEAEKNGAPGKIMNFMNAMTLLTVPRLSVIIRKSYGRARLPGEARGHRAGKRRVGAGGGVRRAGGDQARGNARLPDPHARRLPAAHDARGGAAPHAQLADVLLMPGNRELGARKSGKEVLLHFP